MLYTGVAVDLREKQKRARDREQALIDMVKNTSNRLAEQVAKNLSEEQVAAIIQKIRQIQRDLITAVINGSEIDWRKNEKCVANPRNL